MKIKDKLKSRKFWLTVATVIFAITGWITGNIEPLEAMKIILAAVGIYNGAEAIVDYSRQKRG